MSANPLKNNDIRNWQRQPTIDLRAEGVSRCASQSIGAGEHGCSKLKRCHYHWRHDQRHSIGGNGGIKREFHGAEGEQFVSGIKRKHLKDGFDGVLHGRHVGHKFYGDDGDNMGSHIH